MFYLIVIVFIFLLQHFVDQMNENQCQIPVKVLLDALVTEKLLVSKQLLCVNCGNTIAAHYDGTMFLVD